MPAAAIENCAPRRTRAATGRPPLEERGPRVERRRRTSVREPSFRECHRFRHPPRAAGARSAPARRSRLQRRQAAEIAGRARADRRGGTAGPPTSTASSRTPRIAPRRRPRRKRRSVDADHRRRRRGRDVQRPGVAADEQLAALDQRAQFGRSNSPKSSTRPAAAPSPARAARAMRVGRRPIRWSRAEDDAAAGVHSGQRGDHAMNAASGQRRNGLPALT